MTTTTHSHKHWTSEGGHVTITLTEQIHTKIACHHEPPSTTHVTKDKMTWRDLEASRSPPIYPAPSERSMH
jgi:hypothetical protein